jgi:hypothetical protein
VDTSHPQPPGSHCFHPSCCWCSSWRDPPTPPDVGSDLQHSPLPSSLVYRRHWSPGAFIFMNVTWSGILRQLFLGHSLWGELNLLWRQVQWVKSLDSQGLLWMWSIFQDTIVTWDITRPEYLKVLQPEGTSTLNYHRTWKPLHSLFLRLWCHRLSCGVTVWWMALTKINDVSRGLRVVPVCQKKIASIMNMYRFCLLFSKQYKLFK